MMEEIIKQQIKSSPLFKKIGLTVLGILVIILAFIITNIILIVKILG